MVERLALSAFRRRIVAGTFPYFSSLSDALKRMQFVQADPIRSPARAQDLILRQRIPNYVAGDLEEAFPNLELEEGYLFAYGFMTRDVWRSLRWRSHRQLKKRELAILEAVTELGDVHPRGLDKKFGRKSVKNYWGGKSQESKRILETLHHHGFLRVSRREKGIRVYQVPEDSDGKKTNPFQRYCHLALTTADVFGPTTKSFLMSELRSQNHLLPSRTDRLSAIESLVKSGRLATIEVAGMSYLWKREDWLLSEVPERVRILAPFDPLVRNRERFSQLWGWKYRFEAYVPAAKRERGYYAMPVLWRDEVIGWANAKLEKKRLNVEFGFAGKRPRTKRFRLLAEEEVESMARFLGLADGDWEVTF